MAFGIYVHWPFCAAKCPYCDFNSHVRESIDQQVWRDAYAREISYYADLIKSQNKGQGDRLVTSIFFGGGTPSLMEPETVEAVIKAIRKEWRVSNDCEITLEANPTSVETAKFQAFRGVGVDRVSIGVQSLVPNALSFLGREHNVDEAIIAIETAAECFDRYSFDLMYGRPEQSIEEWQTELTCALPYTGGHLSLYQLTIEKGTPFYTRHQRGEFIMPDQDKEGDFYELTQAILEGAGLAAYEISNHAVPFQESRHNLTYWHYDDYLGIGPGAHGRLTLNGQKFATRMHNAPEIWLERVSEKGHGTHPHELVAPQKRFTECLMMGLRLREGVPFERLSQEAANDWAAMIETQKLERLISEGYITLSDTHITATDEGRQRLNGLLNYLL
jgi:oxygen-independent coproporphyrinogen-3 oxidase